MKRICPRRKRVSRRGLVTDGGHSAGCAVAEITVTEGNGMNKHGKKMIAPIVISVIMVLYFILYFAILTVLIDNLIIKLALGVIPALSAVVMIFVCVQRIREIKGGEEDDLSKY